MDNTTFENRATRMGTINKQEFQCGFISKSFRRHLHICHVPLKTCFPSGNKIYPQVDLGLVEKYFSPF